MATYVGKCLYCEDGVVEYESKQVRGKKTKVYSCSNNKVTTVDEGETWEPTSDSTCSWKLFGSSLERWGKKFIGPKEVKKLLAGDEVIAHMYSYVKKVEYKKYLTISEEYGVSVLWEMDVEENDNEIENKPYKKEKPQKKVFSNKKMTKVKNNENVFSKEDMKSLVLPNDTINIVSKDSISKKEYQQQNSEKEFKKRTFIKPVFFNKKSTDEGAAF